MENRFIPYQDGATNLEGFVSYSPDQKSPSVILCHAWEGRGSFICEKAKEVASWGYVGFALDMYGKNVLGKTQEENAALKKPFIENRGLLQRRVLTAFEVACNLSYVDSSRVAVLGLGFGGMAALDLARSGVNLKGAISLYGHFDLSPSILMKPIQAKILVLHGYLDPVSPQAELIQFEKEMDEAKVDWQAHIYGKAQHAFATPGANNPDRGILYSPTDATRAWVAIRNFLEEVLA